MRLSFNISFQVQYEAELAEDATFLDLSSNNLGRHTGVVLALAIAAVPQSVTQLDWGITIWDYLVELSLL